MISCHSHDIIGIQRLLEIKIFAMLLLEEMVNFSLCL